MLPLNDITQLAIKVQSATAERENTAVRVGTAIAELCKYVNQLPTVAGFSFVASANGVDLVIKTLTEEGQEASTAVAVPLLSAEKAGMLTPQMLMALRADIRKDFSNFEKQVRDLIRASEEVMSRPLGELAGKVEETQTAISQLNSEIVRLDSFVRISCNEERGAVEQLLGAIEREEQGRKVFYLSKFIPEAALEDIRAKFPTLKIEQPPFSVVKYHDAVPTGTFATNHENQTGVEYGKPYECSGHVKRILDNRFRVMLKRGADGTKRWVRLNQDNPLLSAKGETVNYDGDHGWAFVHEPHYWYKGVNDHLHASHYAVFASGEKEPPRPEGKRLELSELEKTAGVRISGNDTFTTYSQFKETLAGHAAYKVTVRGFAFVRIPVTANADDAIAVFDKDGRVLQRINPSALEGVYSGSYVVVRLDRNADFVAFSLTEPLPLEISHSQNFLWLTNSNRPADWEPEWVEHRARFVSFIGVTWDKDAAGQPYLYIGSKNPNNQQHYGYIHREEIKPLHQGFDAPRYEDFKDMMQLYYARFGNRNAEMRYNGRDAVGTYNVFHFPFEAYTRVNPRKTILPNGSEIQTYPSLFMGYAFRHTPDVGNPFFDGEVLQAGLAVVRGDDGNRYSNLILRNEVKNEVIKHFAQGKYLDLIPVATDASLSSSQFYMRSSGYERLGNGWIFSLSKENVPTDFGNNVMWPVYYSDMRLNEFKLSTLVADCTEVESYSDIQ